MCDELFHDGSDFWGQSQDRFMLRLAVIEAGRNICFGGKGGGSAPSPDPLIGQSAVMNAELGKQWLDFAKEQFNVGNDRQSDLDALTKKVTQQQIDTQDKSNARADEQWQYYKDQFQPVEKRMAEEALGYDSEERKAAAAGQAGMEAAKQFAAARDANNRNMARMGVNPNSGKFAASQNTMAVQEALGKAAAQTGARNRIADMGIMLRKDAANFGRNMPGTAAQSYGLGLNAGNSALANQGAANANWQANNNVMNQGFGGAMQGISNQGNILNQQYNSQLNAWSAQQQAGATSAAGLGSMLGTGIGAYAAL